MCELKGDITPILDLPESPRIVKRNDGKVQRVTRAIPVGPIDPDFGRIAWDGDGTPWQACMLEGNRVRCKVGGFDT